MQFASDAANLHILLHTRFYSCVVHLIETGPKFHMLHDWTKSTNVKLNLPCLKRSTITVITNCCIIFPIGEFPTKTKNVICTQLLRNKRSSLNH